MPTAEQTKAEAFRAMHFGDEVLLLPNAWDVASARMIEEAGFPAIATTSAGIAFSLGYPDGQKISRKEMLAAVARIAQAVRVPVTADVEAGYGPAPEDAAQTAQEVIAAGAVGMNLEDGTGDRSNPLVELALQVEKIRAVREVANRLRVALVLNARTDAYLGQVGDAKKRYDETVRRLQAYREAGADCLFVPGVKDVPTIKRLVTDLHHPLNVLAGLGSPSTSELHKIGVARISLGSGPMRATLGFLRRLAEELRTKGNYTGLEGAPSHTEMNRLMARTT